MRRISGFNFNMGREIDELYLDFLSMSETGDLP